MPSPIPLHSQTLPALSDDKAVELAEMFRLLGDASRLRIVIETLAGPQSVGHMAATLGLSPSLVSHHLRLLRAARLVSPERRGKQIFYRIHDAHVRHVIADMIAHVNEEPHEEQV
ncbi:MAG: metalloregulator ArsR/SmtB family transcription factor [Parvibaculum sp.]|jgi:ArsR family transcriptional regulator|uniref:ArsR/SmtB family transcription factor n=1 Tax=Parvibaculum sp. TaxID=2024848 RepID=UPI003C734DDF